MPSPPRGRARPTQRRHPAQPLAVQPTCRDLHLPDDLLHRRPMQAVRTKQRLGRFRLHGDRGCVLAAAGPPTDRDHHTARGKHGVSTDFGISAEPADHALGRSRSAWTTKINLACEQGQRPLSVVITAGQRAIRRSSPRRWRPSACPVWALAVRAPVPFGSAPARLALRGATVLTCAAAALHAPFPSRWTRSATGSDAVRRADALPRSTVMITRQDTPSRAASTDSSGTGRWPPATTSWRSALKPVCISL